MIREADLDRTLKILKIRTKILSLNLQQLKLGNYRSAEELATLDSALSLLTKGITKYDFISRINSGHSLLVGEGNLSFTVSLIKKLNILPVCISSSTYENYDNLSDFAKSNVVFLRKSGVNVLHSINATKLHKTFNHDAFDTIIFQFPHSGSRCGIRGLNSNYVLVRHFIISASYVLKKNGVILITAVDTDFYNNMFRFDELAQELKIPKPKKYKFDPKDYPEYEHTMTHQDDSGIADYSKFSTWEFKL